MGERRSLIEGITETDPSLDPTKVREFLGGAKTPAKTALSAPATPQIARSPFSTRIRTDFANALKRASLERQLNGIQPHRLVDILEQAIEPWLKSNGYLP